MKEFTFAVITYNSEKTVVESLESIKYQVDHYGKEWRIHLVIADDCSTDDTITMVNKWIEVNKPVFSSVEVLTSEENRGLCANFAKAIEHVETESFKILAGDDIICSQNIIENVRLLSDDVIRVCLKVSFRNGKIQIKDDDIANHMYYCKMKHTNRKDISLIGVRSPYATVEMLYKRKLFTKECLDFIQMNRNFEDDPYLWHILKNDSNVKFEYVMEPCVLYRRSDTALSSGIPSVGQLTFLDDLHRFRKYMLKHEEYLPTKFMLLLVTWDTFLMKHRFSGDHTLIRKYRNWIYNCNAKKVKRSNGYNDSISTVYAVIEREQNYLDYISSQSKKFLGDLDGYI